MEERYIEIQFYYYIKNLIQVFKYNVRVIDLIEVLCTLNNVDTSVIKYLVKQIREDKRFQKLSDIALINVGITTGNNKYFSVNQKTVEMFWNSRYNENWRQMFAAEKGHTLPEVFSIFIRGILYEPVW